MTEQKDNKPKVKKEEDYTFTESVKSIYFRDGKFQIFNIILTFIVIFIMVLFVIDSMLNKYIPCNDSYFKSSCLERLKKEQENKNE